jgi:hypothetical protein
MGKKFLYLGFAKSRASADVGYPLLLINLENGLALPLRDERQIGEVFTFLCSGSRPDEYETAMIDSGRQHPRQGVLPGDREEFAEFLQAESPEAVEYLDDVERYLGELPELFSDNNDCGSGESPDFFSGEGSSDDFPINVCLPVDFSDDSRRVYDFERHVTQDIREVPRFIREMYDILDANAARQAVGKFPAIERALADALHLIGVKETPLQFRSSNSRFDPGPVDQDCAVEAAFRGGRRRSNW